MALIPEVVFAKATSHFLEELAKFEKSTETPLEDFENHVRSKFEDTMSLLRTEFQLWLSSKTANSSTTEETVQSLQNGTTKVSKRPKPIVVCQQCGHEIPRANYKYHIRTVHSGKPFRCIICSDGFKKESDLRRHHASIHGEKRECPVCKKEVNCNPVLFKQHMRSHEGQKFECTACGKMLRTKFSLSEHMERMHTAAEMVVCELCGKNVHKLNMRTHISQVHAQGDFTCKLCPGGKKFLNKHNLKKHLEWIHQGGNHICSICGRKCFSASRLRDHELLHQGIKANVCPHCGKTYARPEGLRRHVEGVHLKINQKTFLCGLCPKAYNAKKSLDDHMNTHLGLRPHVCSTCGASFSFRGAKFTHVKLMHGPNIVAEASDS